MKNSLFLICIIACCLTLMGQSGGSQKEPKYIFFDTEDPLFWKGERYLLNRSFLMSFKGFKKIYPNVSGEESTWVVGVKGDSWEQNYGATWLLVDSMLYLRDIYFPVMDSVTQLERAFPHNEQYAIMEQLTGERFQKNRPELFEELCPAESPLGSMKAVWVEGDFYIKRPRKYTIEFKEPYEEWKEAPYYKLTFKAGRLVSVKEWKPKPEVARLKAKKR